MSLHILRSGVQASLQGRPRAHYRHLGMPWSGPADPLSHAIANRLAGNGAGETAIEITLGGFSAQAETALTLALTGAEGAARIDGVPALFHRTLQIKAGQTLELDPPHAGVRTYLAVAGGFETETFLGSGSTYMPARLGGLAGRALRPGDTIGARPPDEKPQEISTPPQLRPHIGKAWSLRTCAGPEFSQLTPAHQSALFSGAFKASRMADRMGVRLEGQALKLASDGKMKSAAVFPGTVQCPQHGQPILLLCDAQTTGGYPRIAQIARCDRHMLGQIRPGDPIQFLKRTPEAAICALQDKTALLRPFLPDVTL